MLACPTKVTEVTDGTSGNVTRETALHKDVTEVTQVTRKINDAGNNKTVGRDELLAVAGADWPDIAGDH